MACPAAYGNWDPKKPQLFKKRITKMIVSVRKADGG